MLILSGAEGFEAEVLLHSLSPILLPHQQHGPHMVTALCRSQMDVRQREDSASTPQVVSRDGDFLLVRDSAGEEKECSLKQACAIGDAASPLTKQAIANSPLCTHATRPDANRGLTHSPQARPWRGRTSW